jgi:hypothetical protein
MAPEQLAGSTEVVDWVKDAYVAFVQLSLTPKHSASLAWLDRIGAEFKKASFAFGVALSKGETELAEREAENAQLRAQHGDLRQRVSDRLAASQRDRTPVEASLQRPRRNPVKFERNAMLCVT